MLKFDLLLISKSSCVLLFSILDPYSCLLVTLDINLGLNHREIRLTVCLYALLLYHYHNQRSFL